MKKFHLPFRSNYLSHPWNCSWPITYSPLVTPIGSKIQAQPWEHLQHHYIPLSLMVSTKILKSSLHSNLIFLLQEIHWLHSQHRVIIALQHMGRVQKHPKWFWRTHLEHQSTRIPYYIPGPEYANSQPETTLQHLPERAQSVPIHAPHQPILIVVLWALSMKKPSITGDKIIQLILSISWLSSFKESPNVDIVFQWYYQSSNKQRHS